MGCSKVSLFSLKAGFSWLLFSESEVLLASVLLIFARFEPEPDARDARDAPADISVNGQKGILNFQC